MRALSPIPESCVMDEHIGVPDEVLALIDEVRAAVTRPVAHEEKMAEALSAISVLLKSQQHNTDHLVRMESQHVLRVGLFVDVANLALRLEHIPQLDYQQLRQLVSRNRRLTYARAYCPVVPEYTGRLQDQRSVAPVWNRGFKVITKPTRVFPDGTRKADLDIDLAIDVVRCLGGIDVLALASGDSDFVPLVEFVQEQGVQVECYCYGETLGEELRLAADAVYDLHDYPELHNATPAGHGRPS